MFKSVSGSQLFQLDRSIRFGIQRTRSERDPSASSALVAGLAVALCLALPSANAHAIPTSAGYAISTVDPGGSAYGDVVTVADYVFVGVGSFGSSEIVRIAPGGATTTIATGFSSLAGFAYDSVNDRLIVGDNANDGVTGDTVYALSNPVGFAGPPAAAIDLELLPFGSIPGIADIAVDPNDPTGMTLFITDATEAFPPTSGALLELAVGTSTLTTVFEVGAGWFAAGVAASNGSLFVGDSIFATGGRVHTTALPLGGGVPTVDLLVDIQDGMAGQLDLELEGDGMLLSTSVDELVRIDPSNGNLSTVASGFGFASGLAVADDASIFVIDGTTLYKLTAIPEPGTVLLVGVGLLGMASARRRV